MPLKAAEIIAHPAFKTVEWDLKPSKDGFADVARGRPGGPFKLKWEVHGQGPVKLVVSFSCPFLASFSFLAARWVGLLDLVLCYAELLFCFVLESPCGSTGR